MITTINYQGEQSAAIVFKGHSEADMTFLASSIINIFALVFSSDENMEYVDSATMFDVLELYKSITENSPTLKTTEL
jgi:hypothetical protein